MRFLSIFLMFGRNKAGSNEYDSIEYPHSLFWAKIRRIIYTL